MAARYSELLAGVPGVEVPHEGPHRRSWFIYYVRLAPEIDRAAVIDAMAQRGISTRPYLPAIHLQPAYRRLGMTEGMLPVTERVARSTLALPFYVQLEDEDIEFVCASLREVLESSGCSAGGWGRRPDPGRDAAHGAELLGPAGRSGRRSTCPATSCCCGATARRCWWMQARGRTSAWWGGATISRGRWQPPGATIGDVDLLVMTHLDFDHAGGCCEFSNARLAVPEGAVARLGRGERPRAEHGHWGWAGDRPGRGIRRSRRRCREARRPGDARWHRAS